MLITLNQFLNLKQITPCLILAANEDLYPLRAFCNTFGQDLVPPSSLTTQIYNLERSAKDNLILEELKQSSLFDEGRLIIINLKTKLNLELKKLLLELSANLTLNDYLIVNLDKLDKSDLTWVGKFPGTSLNLSNKDLINNIGLILKLKGVNLTTEAIDLLLSHTMSNSASLFQEVSRLNFLKQGTISLSELKSFLTQDSKYTTFELSEYYLSGNLIKTQEIFEKVANSSEDLIFIAWGVMDNLRKMLLAKNFLKNHKSVDNALAEAKIWTTQYHLFKAALNRLNYYVLSALFVELGEVDKIIKGLISGDARFKLKTIIYKICQGV